MLIKKNSPQSSQIKKKEKCLKKGTETTSRQKKIKFLRKEAQNGGWGGLNLVQRM